MAAISRSDRDHQRRVLDHQEKSAAARAAAQGKSDPQLKIPLIGEVRHPGAAPAAKPPRPRGKRAADKPPAQPKLLP